jgi:molybdopterin-guanine dinucleotide biosynthesis protein A
MLQRVVRLIGESAAGDNMVVIAAPNQTLPAISSKIVIVRDEREYRGPLEGLATGLRALQGKVDAVYATACDVPLLAPAFVDRMFQLLDDFDIAVPFDGEHHHPLAAVYRVTVLSQIQELLDADRLRPRFLFDEVRTREVPVDDLRSIDPQLSTLENLNYEADYLNALEAAGFSP